MTGMNENRSPSPAPPAGLSERHWINYPKFIWRVLGIATDGGPLFYAWMTALTAMALVGANAWAHQVSQGMIETNMTDHVSWGLYIANFTFMVGVAAGAVMMVIPAYLYHDRDMHDVVIIGELLAVAAIIMCLLFVNVDLGRPDRFWHMMPVIGRFHWPISMLTWDVIVLTGYLLINLHVCGYQIYIRFLGRKPDPKWYVPFVLISIVWAVSIHTVTAFLYCGLGGRPFWNTALLAPRFLASAFISGPAFIILTLLALRHFGRFTLGTGPVRTLVNIVRVSMAVNVIMVLSEIFTSFYSGGTHSETARYLYVGLHGHAALVPWIWASLVLTVLSVIIFYGFKITEYPRLLAFGCMLAFAGIWIEKGMGMIIPAFVPSTLHEMVEYTPSLLEWKVMVGIWAFGLMVYTVALKVALAVFTGTVTASVKNPG